MVGATLISGWLALTTAGQSPGSWSPDGRWLTYTLAPQSPHIGSEAGWIFETGSAERTEHRAPSVRAGGTCTVWACQVGTGESVRLGRWGASTTAPSWSPQGGAIAVARLVGVKGSAARFEVLLIGALGRERILWRRDRMGGETSPAAIAQIEPAWSPDGRLLAMPLPNDSGIAILSVEGGRLFREIEHARAPSWSPDGGRLAYYQTREPTGLMVLDAPLGDPRRLSAWGPVAVLSAPCWARDGRTILALRQRTDPGPRPGLVHLEFDRVPFASTEIPALSREPVRRGEIVRRGTLALDRDGEEFYFAWAVSGRPTQVARGLFRPNGVEIQDRFHPLDPTCPIVGLAASPTARLLAVRVETRHGASPPGLYDPATDRLSPLIPDEDARRSWLAAAEESLSELLRTQLPVPVVDGKDVERATLLPSPGELPPEHEALVRIKKVLRVAAPLAGTEGSGRAEGAEARLVVSYLEGDYEEAARELDTVEALEQDPRRRDQLDALRAQILMGRGDYDRASAILAALRAQRSGPSWRIEETRSGFRGSPLDAARDGWADVLTARLRALRERRQPGDTPGVEWKERSSSSSNLHPGLHRRSPFEGDGAPNELAPAGAIPFLTPDR